MTDDLITRLRSRAYRLAAKDFNGDGARLAVEAADALEAAKTRIAGLEASEIWWSDAGVNLIADAVKNTSRIAALEAENAKLKAKLMAAVGDLRAAAAALKETGDE